MYGAMQKAGLKLSPSVLDSPVLMISRTPCGLAAGMNGKSEIRKSGFDLQVGMKLAKRPVLLAQG